MKRKLYKRDIEQWDRQHRTSNIRLIEMIVDGIVGFQPVYCVQYFRDLEMYGADEAHTYLVRFLIKEGRYDDKAPAVAKLTETIDKLKTKLGVGIVVSTL